MVHVNGKYAPKRGLKRIIQTKMPEQKFEKMVKMRQKVMSKVDHSRVGLR